jgi:erythromycin esterase-like protein
MLEPGLDKHEWESRWQQFEEDLVSDPAELLPEIDRLVEEMLEARGYAVADLVVREGDDRDVVAEFLGAREITRAVERGAEVEREDLYVAVENYRSLYGYLSVDRAPP